MRHPLYTLSYFFLRSIKTRKKRLWSTLASSWVSFSSMMTVPVPILSQNPWITLWKWILVRRLVSMSASTTFQRVSRSPIPQVSVEPLGIRAKMFHTNYWGISPMLHMC